jgi:transcriptional antiterminator Rof (Rho-off)
MWGLKEIKKLKLKLKEKKGEVKDAEAKALAAKTQSEGLTLKYERLLEDNKHLSSCQCKDAHM